MAVQTTDTARTETKVTTNILVVGVGGQGVIMVSKVLARLCQLQGFKVKQSEVHGMAKRGGTVFSHVRFGDEIWSPTIPRGKADVLLALEWAEGLRWINYLKPGEGTFIADTQHIVPPFACRNRKRGALSAYSAETPDEVLAMVTEGYALDATTMATALGNLRASNTVLLGALSGTLDFPVEDWLEVISEFVPPKTVEINREAFLQGRQWLKQQGNGVAAEAPVIPMAKPAPLQSPAELNDDFELRITPEWCKGCDICVKVCPERCLALNHEQIVVVTDREACTGCRLCEWLCPDFAIDIIKNADQRQTTDQRVTA
jgi:indolepyruvate ferredoxin oxidoreductase, beta subunit